MPAPDYDLCVIGGGAAGLVVVAGASTLGARVVLVEKNKLGGDCLYHGCVPSKTLLHTARVAQMQRRACDVGLKSQEPTVDMTAVMRRVRQVIQTLEPHDSPERFRALGVEVIFGAGRFSDRTHFQVNGRALTARHFVLATGSSPALPDLKGLSQVPYFTNQNIFDLNEPVPHLLVLGGGPIGVELAQAFVRLGSRVTLVHTGTRLLAREDADLSDVLSEVLKQEGIELLLQHRPTEVTGAGGTLRLEVSDAHGRSRWVEASHLLVATGRKPNLGGLGLEAAGVEITHGRLQLDRRLRTRNRRIYACGDVAGLYPFTHMAEHQAGVVLRHALFHLPASVERRAVPWCTFTDPELARVGLSEEEAKAAGIGHRVYRFPFARIDRAQADAAPTGLCKVIAAPDGRLLGAAVLGPQAGEVVHEYVLALTHRMRLKDIARAIHIYPTLAQINRRAADEAMKQRLTPRTKRWIKFLFRLRG